MSVLAFDIGGTRIKAGLVAAGRVSSLTAVPTDRSGVAATLLEQVVALGRSVAAGTPIEAVGVSVRGLVDPETGVIDVNPPLDCLSGQPLAAVLASEFGVPVEVENDARMYALGELHHGAARGVANLVCLTLGTGVGVGVAVGGRMLRGERGVWGILGGHFTVSVDGPRCSCGNIGCLEALIGAHAFTADAVRRLRTGVASTLDEQHLDPAAIFAAAAAGDAIATETVERLATVLGCGVVTLIHAYDPDLVVIGGGLSGSAAQFMPQLRDYVREHAWTSPKGRVRVEVSELGDSAPLLGAAELATAEKWVW
jgi:glucokinase